MTVISYASVWPNEAVWPYPTVLSNFYWTNDIATRSYYSSFPYFDWRNYSSPFLHSSPNVMFELRLKDVLVNLEKIPWSTYITPKSFIFKIYYPLSPLYHYIDSIGNLVLSPFTFFRFFNEVKDFTVKDVNSKICKAFHFSWLFYYLFY
ncbi:148aa long hypothetical protein [Pyrococcus horikoshii OT3]|uniref:Uncharacterized protein n=1 Tax=Pyrococcus horikoshii (strain ATCC 700860 / DSM 12428 / JCM 9974 / NBRC 100139 / OT-3) TaxID=70601 RepID=O59589_PYRHO|nr:148aa long hypothetical protein [Pyrococcus horikoshii OT3]